MRPVATQVRRVRRGVMGTLGLTLTLVVAGAGPASAHERRTVGPFVLAVGWGDEPAYTGFKNSVQVTVTEADGGAAVTELDDTLKVDVIKGSDRTSLPLVSNFRVGAFGIPGDYRAWLTPTRPGAYTLRVAGSIRGHDVDETFSSSKTTFDDVADVADIQFPAKDPSPGQVGTRIDREIPRVEGRVRRAEVRADDARTLALVGVGLGALGLLAALGGLVVVLRGRGSRSTPARPGHAVSEMTRPNA
jgi:hypothetical protein